VLAEHEQDVLRPEFVGEVEVRPAPGGVEPLDRRVEVDEPDGDARHADDGEPGLLALGADELALPRVGVERVGEDVDGVEPDGLRLADAVGSALAGLRPRRVDQTELPVRPFGSERRQGTGDRSQEDQLTAQPGSDPLFSVSCPLAPGDSPFTPYPLPLYAVRTGRHRPRPDGPG